MLAPIILGDLPLPARTMLDRHNERAWFRPIDFGNHPAVRGGFLSTSVVLGAFEACPHVTDGDVVRSDGRAETIDDPFYAAAALEATRGPRLARKTQLMRDVVSTRCVTGRREGLPSPLVVDE